MSHGSWWKLEETGYVIVQAKQCVVDLSENGNWECIYCARSQLNPYIVFRLCLANFLQNGNWDDVSGESFLRNLLAMPVGVAKVELVGATWQVKVHQIVFLMRHVGG